MKALYLWAVVLVAVVLAAFSLAGPATQLGWHLAGRVTATAEPLRAPAGGDAGAGATGSVNAIQALAPFGSSAPAPASPDSGDVSDIAGLFGGGGHPAAAGARIPGKLPTTQRRVVAAIRKALDARPS